MVIAVDFADSYGVLWYELLDERLGVDCDTEFMECTEYGLFDDIAEAEFVAVVSILFVVAVDGVDSVRECVLYG